MSPGFKGDNIAFDWKPYEKRTKPEQEDFDRLVLSIYHHGMRDPLITYRPPKAMARFVLIGQRRWEVVKTMNPSQPMRCIDILEDVSAWWKWDVVRLHRLRDSLGRTEY